MSQLSIEDQMRVAINKQVARSKKALHALEKDCGLSDRTLYDFLYRGQKRKYRIDTLQKICEALNIDVKITARAKPKVAAN